jgi:hypothetical protein
MKKEILIIISVIILFSCKEDRDYKTESLILLNQIKHEFNDNSGIFLIHSYGAYMQPIITRQQLENELALFLGDDVWETIKVQREISRSFENQIMISKNQIPISEFHLFIEETKRKRLPFWDNLVERYTCVSGISIPIFSEDFTYAFVCEYGIYGALAGGGTCRVYQKDKDDWVLVKTFNEWIS